MKIRCFVLCFLVMGLFPWFVFGQNYNLVKVGEYVNNNSDYGDVFVSGNYAYCTAAGDGLHIIDISDPHNPSLEAAINTDIPPRRVHVSGNYAYVIDGGGGYTWQNSTGLQVIDVTNPLQPALSPILYIPHAKSLYVSGNYAYVTADDHLKIINVSTPMSPGPAVDFLLSPTIDPYPYHWGIDVYVKGIFAFVAINRTVGGSDDDDYLGFQVVDVSNPMVPTEHVSYTSWLQYPLAVYVEFDSNFGTNFAYLMTHNGLRIFELDTPVTNDPFDIIEEGQCADCNSSDCFNGDIKIAGDYAYLASGNKGLILVDISDPSAPTKVGEYTDVSATGIYGGARGIHVEGNYAYLACGNVGGTGKLVILNANFPIIGMDHTNLNFGASLNDPSTITGPQSLFISNTGGDTLNWSVSDDRNWLYCTPSSGTNNGEVLVDVDATGLLAGAYNGTITISAPDAVNSPQTVEVHLDVYNTQLSGPFGVFATPIDGSTVTGSIAVTGWALDNIGVQGLQVYRRQGNNLVFIGDAYFVEGARPDVEQAFPDYPLNYKAGWGYMMLTNFLPNGGNGTFQIEAIATDIEGNQASLGTKTIICDNANAVKPFGAIDTPTQGGTASGSNFINWGWALTPQPKIINPNGSTINVYVDGINLGHPVYNLSRPNDVEFLFPGYANTSLGNHPGGRFSIDTTAYENGVHTIQWTVTDSDNITDGIGSRYFVIQNLGTSLSQAQTASFNIKTARRKFSPLSRNPNIPINDFESISIRRGFSDDSELEVVTCKESGVFMIEIDELERLMIEFPGNNRIIVGYTEIGNFFKPLPIGSTLDTKARRFYWQPGPGFIGEYSLIIVEQMDSNRMKIMKKVIVRIEPKLAKYKD